MRACFLMQYVARIARRCRRSVPRCTVEVALSRRSVSGPASCRQSSFSGQRHCLQPLSHGSWSRFEAYGGGLWWRPMVEVVMPWYGWVSSIETATSPWPSLVSFRLKVRRHATANICSTWLHKSEGPCLRWCMALLRRQLFIIPDRLCY